MSLEAALQRIAQLESENEDLRSDALERDAIPAQSREFIASTLAGFKPDPAHRRGPDPKFECAVRVAEDASLVSCSPCECSGVATQVCNERGKGAVQK